jgi:hypothetical protein
VVKHLPYKTNPFLAGWSFDHITLISPKKTQKIYLPKSSPNLMMVIQWFLTAMFPISGQIIVIHYPETCGHFGMIPLINHDWGRSEVVKKIAQNHMVPWSYLPTISSAPGRTLVQLLPFRPRAAGARATVDFKRWETWRKHGKFLWELGSMRIGIPMNHQTWWLEPRKIVVSWWDCNGHSLRMFTD